MPRDLWFLWHTYTARKRLCVKNTIHVVLSTLREGFIMMGKRKKQKEKQKTENISPQFNRGDFYIVPVRRSFM